LNTVIIEKNENGEETPYDVFSKLVESRVLFVYDFIDDGIATDIVASLLYLDHEDDSKKISLYINSPGGDIRSIFMIYDIMNLISSPIETICVGSAMGESALILAAGDEGMRMATQNAMIKINQLSCTDPSSYLDMANVDISIENNKKDNAAFIQALSNLTGKTTKYLLKKTERDLYLSPPEAKKYGIIDAIIG
jgi:ATP-dependent Clp protease protease subunit